LVRTGFESFETQKACKKDKDDLLAQSQELNDIISSCNGIIYVDNPSTLIEEDSEDDEDDRTEKQEKASWNEEKRKASRERVLNHLAENCSEIYKLKS
jgi:hypothetical protein